MRRSLLALLPLAVMAAALLALPFAAAAQSPSPTSSPSPATGTPAPVGTTTPSASPATSPTPPAGSPTPPPAATPWPAPANLRVTIEGKLLDENNFPLPPERQEHTDVLRWDHLAGFTGEYEVEVTLVPYDGTFRRSAGPNMRFPAERGPGEIRRASQYPEWLRYQRCYRIRTTIPSGAGTIETGPWSNEACTVRPPSSGPGNFEILRAGMGMSYSSDYRVSYVDFNWVAAPDFPGDWVIERAFVSRESAVNSVRNFETIATLPASVSDGVRGHYKEQVASTVVYTTPPCYRARGVVNGQTVAYSDEVCAFLPTDTVPPGPPDTGTGTGLASAHPGTWFLEIAAMLAALGAGGAAAVAVSVSRRR